MASHTDDTGIIVVLIFMLAFIAVMATTFIKSYPTWIEDKQEIHHV